MKLELPPVGCRLGVTRERRISIARNGDQTNNRITAARPMRSHRGQPLGLGVLEGSGMGGTGEAVLPWWAGWGALAAGEGSWEDAVLACCMPAERHLWPCLHGNGWTPWITGQ